jgi:hypothetical protein
MPTKDLKPYEIYERFKVTGLQSKKHLNGLCGKILEEIDPESGRYPALLRDGSQIRIKP